MSGSSTRDWLLDKLLKMRVALTEMKADSQQKIAEALAVRDAAVAEAARLREDFMEAHQRMQQMAPGKQFHVTYRSAAGDTMPLAILSVRTCHGETTITVERGS